MNRRHFIKASAAAAVFTLFRPPSFAFATRASDDMVFVSATGVDAAAGSELAPVCSLREATRRLRQSLPVELVSFQGAADGDAVILSWETASETNNAGFAIERYANGQWTEPGFSPGHGSTLEARRYTHRLAGLGTGQHRFRLRQVDYDGSATYSAEVEVVVQVSRVFAAPNPARNVVRVHGLASHETATLYDTLGRRVHTVTSAGSPVTLDTAALPRGTYFLVSGRSSQAVTLH